MRPLLKKLAPFGLLFLIHSAALGAPIFDLELFFRSSAAQLVFDLSPEGLVRRGVLRDWIESSSDPISAQEIESRLDTIRVQLENQPSDPELLNRLTADQFGAREAESYQATRQRFSRPDELLTRLQAFADRWHSNVAWVDNVGFDMEHDVAPTRAHRQVLVISTQGNGQAELLRDSLVALGSDTVSFPMREGASHLFVRTGADTLDFGTRSFRRGAYALPSAARLEPVVLLSRQESAKLALYTSAALANPNLVLGQYGFNGVESGSTQGRLDANRGSGSEKHNCVSWIAMAPIGQGGRPLLELVGARPDWIVHTNPGWWANYLVAGAPAARVPFVLYWTDEPLATALLKVRAGLDFPQWDFNRQ